MPRNGTLCLIACALLVSVGAWAQESEKKLSEDISYGTYGEEAARTKVVVSSVPAKIEKPKLYLPLEIAIGLRGEGPEIHFSYESFQLIDAQGNYSATATPEDLQKNLEIWLETERMRQMRPIQTADFFYGFKPVASNFYPKTGGARGTSLDQNMFLRDVIYFPVPSSLDGVMTLVISGDGMKEPVEVNFEVPEKKTKEEKEESKK